MPIVFTVRVSFPRNRRIKLLGENVMQEPGVAQRWVLELMTGDGAGLEEAEGRSYFSKL